MRFVKKGSDCSREVLTFVKKVVKSVGFMTIRKKGSQQTRRFDSDVAQPLCFTRVILRKVGQYGTESRFATDLMPARRRGRRTCGGEVKQRFGSKSMVFLGF